MKVLIATGKIFRHGPKTFKNGEGDTIYLCTYTQLRSNHKGGWTTEYHNIYMPLTDEFIEKFHDVTSYEMVKSKDMSPKDAKDLTDIVIVQGEFGINVYAGKGSTVTYVESPEQVAIIRKDSPWFDEDEAVLIERFVTYGPAGFEDEDDM